MSVLTRRRWFPIVMALLAAAVSGAGVPFVKLLLDKVEPIVLAALLYLGSGLAMIPIKLIRRSARSLRIKRSDWKWLAGSVAVGGVAAPVLLILSLRHTPAATASLLLSFEGVMTALIAAVLFRETISRRALAAIGCGTLASLLLAWDANGEWGVSIGVLGVLATCMLWALDNCFTCRLSAKDPTSVVFWIGLYAGAASLVLSLLLGRSLPELEAVLAALVLGSVSYGLSVVLILLVQRELGAARTSTLFNTQILYAVAFSVVIFSESLSLGFLIALMLAMAAARLLHSEQRCHPYISDAASIVQ